MYLMNFCKQDYNPERLCDYHYGLAKNTNKQFIDPT